MTSWFLRFYKLINLLSLDVACGAVVSAVFFADVFAVPVRPAAFACLGITVWIIYTADHLCDAKRTSGIASTNRHQFHQRHFRLLLLLAALAVAIDLILCFFIRPRVLHWGLGLAVVTALYLLFQPVLRVLKEPAGAILYSAGVLMPSLPSMPHSLSPELALIIAQFAITALINLVLFSWFDHARDVRDNRTSVITIVGQEKGEVLLVALFIVQGALGVCTAALSSYAVVAILIIMNLSLFMIFLYRPYFSVGERWRYAGDAVFFLPLLFMIHLT